MALTLNEFKSGLVALTERTFHNYSPDNCPLPKLIWQEYGRSDLNADNIHAEKSVDGYLHLFTKSDTEPLFASVEAFLNSNDIGWAFDEQSVDESTGTLHYVWRWNIIG